MLYWAAASQAFLARNFSDGVTASTLAHAPSLVFSLKVELQARWARRLCHRHVELPGHTLPSPQAIATAALAGMGWGMQLEVMVAPYLKDSTLVELVPGTPLDVPLYWQQARAAVGVLEGFNRAVLGAARGCCWRFDGSRKVMTASV